MISFKRFLNEEVKLPRNVQISWRETSAPEEIAIDWLKENSFDAITRRNYMYRGFGRHLSSDFTFIDPRGGKRTSLDSNGLYQLMMDSSAAMKEIPSRSNSLICTANDEDAKMYGHVYLVFPKLGTKIAASDESDYWENIINGEAAKIFGITTINHMNKKITTALHNIGMDISPRSRLSIKEIDDDLNKFQVTFETFCSEFNISNTAVKSKLEKQIAQQGGKNFFTALANVIATPDNFGVYTFTYDGIKMPKESELWFSDEALVISDKAFTALAKKHDLI